MEFVMLRKPRYGFRKTPSRRGITSLPLGPLVASFISMHQLQFCISSLESEYLSPACGALSFHYPQLTELEFSQKSTWVVVVSHSVMPDFLWPHGLQHARLPCPSLSPRVCSNSCALSHWCHPAISSSVILFSSSLQFFPAPGSFPVSQFFASGGQSIGVSTSASVLPMNIQDRFPLGLTGWISLLSKGLSRVFSSPTVWRHFAWCTFVAELKCKHHSCHLICQLP